MLLMLFLAEPGACMLGVVLRQNSLVVCFVRPEVGWGGATITFWVFDSLGCCRLRVTALLLVVLKLTLEAMCSVIRVLSLLFWEEARVKWGWEMQPAETCFLGLTIQGNEVGWGLSYATYELRISLKIRLPYLTFNLFK